MGIIMKRITLLTLCIAMLLSIAALSGCTDKEGSAPVKTVDLIENGASAYVMIRPDDVSDALRSSVSDLRLRIREKTTVMLDLRSDADGEAAATEIVIGATNRPESASAAEGLGENQFRIVKKMPPVEFEEVERLDDPDRGGFGSTGAS